MADHTDLKIALAILIPSFIVGALIIITTNAAFALFPVQNLNSFTTTNQTSGEPVFVIVGEFTNNGPDREDFVDIAATLYDENRRIIGVSPFYDDDVKPGDTVPFSLQIPASQVENGDLAKVADFRVTAE